MQKMVTAGAFSYVEKRDTTKRIYLEICEYMYYCISEVNGMTKNTMKSKARVLWLMGFFVLALIALFCRMIYWQVVRGAELRNTAYTQQTKNRTISPSRGKIYDANGIVLAESVTVETISITPKNITNKEKTAKGLAELLDLDY